jgi:hypothetical protein
MGERPDEVRRRDPLGEPSRDTDLWADPAGRPEEAMPVTGPDPALVGAEAALDQAQENRLEIERTRAEIERTRADMSETVDAIQGRLSPANLKEQAKDRVKEATVGRAQGTGSAIVETIRENPLPAVLTGIGLTWLLTSARRSSTNQRRYRDRDYAYDFPTAYDYPPHYEERGTSGHSEGPALDRAQSRVGDAAGRARDRVGETASQTQDKAGQVASQAQDRASRLGDQAQYQARRARGGFERRLRGNPLAVGALAVGVGAAVGLAIPETSKEHEVMGEARDNLVETAQEKVQETQQKAQRVAEEARSAAQEEAENQGLTNQ